MLSDVPPCFQQDLEGNYRLDSTVTKTKVYTEFPPKTVIKF